MKNQTWVIGKSNKIVIDRNRRIIESNHTAPIFQVGRTVSTKTLRGLGWMKTANTDPLAAYREYNDSDTNRLMWNAPLQGAAK